MVRPGYALYGGNPMPGTTNPMLPVLGLKARIVQVRAVPRGETVGYGATWTASRPARIAIISAGYADGYLRSASGIDACSVLPRVRTLTAPAASSLSPNTRM